MTLETSYPLEGPPTGWTCDYRNNTGASRTFRVVIFSLCANVN